MASKLHTAQTSFTISDARGSHLTNDSACHMSLDSRGSQKKMEIQENHKVIHAETDNRKERIDCSKNNKVNDEDTSERTNQTFSELDQRKGKVVNGHHEKQKTKDKTQNTLSSNAVSSTGSQHKGSLHQSRDVVCAAIEQQYVHDVYNKTAHHFVDVKYKAWPKVKQFILDMEPGSLVADVGCGSGKYLGINKNITVIGCDHSVKLVSVAEQGKHQVLSCDNLHLPFRHQCMDAVISIGVIHHFTTPSRRARAIRELARVLRPGGKVMIYVWAMEQKHRKFKSQDVLVPWHLRTKHHKQVKPKLNKNILEAEIDDEVFEPASKGRSNYPPLKSSHVNNQNYGRKKSSVTSPDFFQKHFKIGKKSSPPALSDVSPTSVKAIPKFDFVHEYSNHHSSCSHHHSCKHASKHTDASFPGLIRNKFLSLIGVEAKVPKIQSAVKKKSGGDLDKAYKKMLQQIIERDHELACQSGDNIPSIFATEGFAVREFPGSSYQEPSTHTDSDEIAHKSDLDSHIITNSALSRALSEPDVSQSHFDHVKIRLKSDDLQNDHHINSEISKSCFTSNTSLQDTKSCLSTNGDTHPSRQIDSEAGTDSMQNGSMEPLNYTQKCSEWLTYGQTNGKSPSVEANNSINSQTMISPSYPLHTNSDLHLSDTEEWAQLTAQAIQSIQTQVDSTEYSSKSKPRLNGTSTVAESLCRCKNGSKASDPNMEKVENKVSQKKRNCSESSMSSMSSMSSDTESNVSDMEDMTVCAVCRGDSVDDTYNDMYNSPNDPQASLTVPTQLPSHSQHGQEATKISSQIQSSQVHASDSGHTLSQPVQHYCADEVNLSSSQQNDYTSLESTLSLSDGALNNVKQPTENFGSSSKHSAHTSHEACSMKSNETQEPTEVNIVNTGIVETKGTENSDSQKIDEDYCNGREKSLTSHENHNGHSQVFLNIQSRLAKSGVNQEGVDPSSTSGTTSPGKLSTDDAHKRFYHVFREEELVELITRRVDSLHIIDSFYDHANWCVVAEKVNVWTI